MPNYLRFSILKICLNIQFSVCFKNLFIVEVLIITIKYKNNFLLSKMTILNYVYIKLYYIVLKYFYK